MVLKGAEVHKYISIQHCHNFLYMMHLWKIAYDVIIVSIEMLKCYIGFYLNSVTAWDARVCTRLDFILSLNEMFGMNHIECWERLKEFQFYIILWKCFIFKWIEILGCRDLMLISYGYDPQVLVRIIDQFRLFWK